MRRGGAFLAMRRSLFEECGGFDAGLFGWGAEDSELCARLWMLGHSCVVVPTIARPWLCTTSSAWRSCTWMASASRG
jgi:GT2 family glycosyltransferase